MLCDFEGLDLNLVTELTTFSDSIKDVCTCKSCQQQTKNGNYYFEANFILGRSFKKDQIVRMYEDSWQIKIKQQIRKSLCKHFLNANFRFIDHLIDV